MKNVPPNVYEWTPQDKRRYFLALLPFLAAVALTAILLTGFSVWLLVGWIGLYLIINIFQAGCCVGCPYRGQYCPAIMGIYFSNWLSGRIYAEREFDSAFFQRNATAAEVVLLIFIIFPLPWLWTSGWVFAALYLLLIAGHYALFMPTQCEHCSYNQTCPGGQTWIRCRSLLGQ